jgi:CheY-like chemotaxis protein
MFDPWQQVRVADPVSPRPGRSRKQKSQPEKPERKKTKILVVDDEHLIADTMTEILKRSGFLATCAYDGASALEMALQLTPDVVLTDVVMPRMNGVQLAIAIRKALPSAQIILLSGQAGISEIVERGQRDGYTFELIPKPVHPERLLRRLQES